MILLLRPVDTFFFRNHKAFSPGENSTAESVFPPRGGTIYGALRSTYIHARSNFATFRQEDDMDLKYWMGTVHEPGNFKIKGCFMYAGGQAILPMPLDYQVISEGFDGNECELAYPLVLEEENHTYSSSRGNLRLLGVRDEKSASSTGAYLPLDQWQYSRLNADRTRIYRSSQWVLTEDKLGIARDWKTATSREGMLYQLQVYRFKESLNAQQDSGFIAICEDAPDFSGIKYLRLGGKNRPWTLEVLPDHIFPEYSSDDEQIIAQIEDSGIARLIFLTPTIFNGEESNFYINQGKTFRAKEQLEFPVLTEAIGRPDLIGGWDIAGKRPKKRMMAIPAGSVFYLEVNKGRAKELVQGIKEQQLSDELAHEGYGWAVCAAYNKGGR
ncbi:MAG: type III-B CRISPR module-associated protein Cmr3 [Clostridia bacterium]|nr:type III-B CRISPR module-associated protein Cmr3 [Clostridia bacterium]